MNYHDGPALAPGTRIDQYTISGVLGRGGFGITYLVRDEALNRDFALKEFFPEGLVRREGPSVRFLPNNPSSESDYRWGLRKFYEEARLLAQFSHANIISVRRVFEANDSAYMLLDFIKGSTLEKWLRGLDSPPTQEELDLICVPLLGALELVHANRTWHLDISPDNIMIRAADGSPLLLDFGASRFELKQHSQLVSALVFKSGYSAPEQYTSNAGRLGPWTDIYAFAATLYRAISGRRPSEATERQLEDEEKPAAVIGKGRYREPFLAAIDWALKIPPRSRPQTVAEWRQQLLEGSPALAPRTARIQTGSAPGEPGVSEGQQVASVRPAGPARAGFPLWVLLAGMIVAVGVGAGGTYFVQEQSRKAQEARAETERRGKKQLELELKRQADAAAAKNKAEQEALVKARVEQKLNSAFVGDIIATQSGRRSSLECRDACLSRAGCKAYEFRLSGGACYLYRSVREQLQSTDAVSGRWD